MDVDTHLDLNQDTKNFIRDVLVKNEEEKQTQSNNPNFAMSE